ncbi:DUF61 family protein [Methanotrichaceae archaeon M04Ac]|jgi:hypothetical protein|uniref:UPF0216 protein P0O24_10335 n=1 Tax=Candidatus Methanocrinis alkalitolerans TaxID=3033395 RepID=A0ABT5XGX7_9EURY|nr:DUF61 family protein [Candidatus Methanocrinis alkalitolerans]MCR3882973.1 DUF61 family protein [Methanothrix sp.]MDF0593977.1 DUF61 family protein [Candidatus Methanocrinis alkalitolerans]
MVAVDNKLIVKTVQSMNQHLPGRRKRLTELLKEEKPGIRGKDNTFYIMDKKELKLISESVPRYLWDRLRLPILIEMAPQYGSGSARIQGEAECMLAKKLLKIDRGDRKMVIVYMPEIRELRRSLPTTSQYAFVTSLR